MFAGPVLRLSAGHSAAFAAADLAFGFDFFLCFSDLPAAVQLVSRPRFVPFLCPVWHFGRRSIVVLPARAFDSAPMDILSPRHCISIPHVFQKNSQNYKKILFNFEKMG